MTTYDCPCCDDFSGDSIQRVWTHVNHKDEEEHREYADSANFDEFKDDVGYEEDDPADDGDSDADGGDDDGDDDTDSIDYDSRLDGGDDGGDSDDGTPVGLPIDPLTLAVVLAVVVIAYYLVKRRSGSDDGDDGGEPAPEPDESEEFDPDAFLEEEGEPVDEGGDEDEEVELEPGTVSMSTGGGLS